MKIIRVVFWVAVIIISFIAALTGADQFFGAGWKNQAGALIVVGGTLTLWLCLLTWLSRTVLEIVAKLVAFTVIAFILGFSSYLVYFVFFRSPILRDLAVMTVAILVCSALGGVITQERKRTSYDKVTE